MSKIKNLCEFFFCCFKPNNEIFRASSFNNIYLFITASVNTVQYVFTESAYLYPC